MMDNNTRRDNNQQPQTMLTLDLYKTKAGALEDSINDVTDIIKTKKENNAVNHLDYNTYPEHYRLHCYYLHGTWILDEVDLDGEPCLFCVEGNSRNLYIAFYYKPDRFKGNMRTNKKKLKDLNSKELYEMIEDFINFNMVEHGRDKRIRDLRYIIWDAAQIHNSDDAKFVLDEYSVKYWMINVKRIGHGHFRVLDRTVRTIRDLIESYYSEAYLKDPVTYILQTKIIDYYNKSPHAALEEMTNIRGMTPWNVHVNEIIERQIIIYCQSWNYNMKMKPHYRINVGDKVLVKNIETYDIKKKRNTYMNNNKVYTVKEIKNGEYILDPPYIPPDLDEPIPVNRSMFVKIRVKEEED